MTGYSQGWLWLPEHRGDNDRAIRADWNLVTPANFQTIGTRILRGRAFELRDDAEGRDVVIVNETLARRVWPGQDPIGRSLVHGGAQARVLEVVGVAGDTKYQTLGEEPQPFVYVPLAQHYHSEMWLLVRTGGPSAIPVVRELLREMDPNLPLVRASTLTEATAFGLLAAAGILIGIGLAAAVEQFLAAFLYGVEPLDAASFTGGALILAALAVAACVVPVRRALRINAMEALRYE